MFLNGIPESVLYQSMRYPFSQYTAKNNGLDRFVAGRDHI